MLAFHLKAIHYFVLMMRDNNINDDDDDDDDNEQTMAIKDNRGNVLLN